MAASQLTALSLFSGIGGLCEGVKLAGFDVLGAAELDRYACESYRHNFPDVPLYEGDVADMFPTRGNARKQQLEEFTSNRAVDLVFGGPPCQGYSQIGPRDVADPRNEMYLELLRVAYTLKSRFVLIENVPNMLLMKKGLFRKRITKALIEHGYDNIGLTVLDASLYGVPQKRKRVFFIAASSKDIAYPLQNALELVSQGLVTSPVTVDEAISDLPESVAEDSGIQLPYPKSKRLSDFQREMRLDTDGMFYLAKEKQSLNTAGSKLLLSNHHTKEIREERLALIRLLEQGKKADSLPKSVWNNARPEKWRRFHPHLPAHTLMAQMHRDLSEWVHPHFDRWITVREAMRLQAFHDGFVLQTSEWQQLKQVGNAVPPLLGRIPALAIQHAIALSEGRQSSIPTGGQLSLEIAAR